MFGLRTGPDWLSSASGLGKLDGGSLEEPTPEWQAVERLWYETGNIYKPYPLPSAKRYPNGEFPDLWGRGFAYPRGEMHEVERSFAKHCLRREESCRGFVAPSAAEREYARALYVQSNPFRCDVIDVADRELFEEAFGREVLTLNFRGSTGLGTFRHYSTIGDALGWEGDTQTCTNAQNYGLLREIVWQRLRSLHGYETQEEAPPTYTKVEAKYAWAEERTRAGYGRPDPMKIFQKGEPHDLAKVADGRWRLIWCPSVEDQMVDRLLFGPWVDAEIDNVDRATSKSGWTPIPEGYRMLHAQMPREDQCLAVDKSSWDWTCPWWVIQEYVEAKLEQVRVLPQGYEMAVRTRMMYMFGPGCRVVWPDGVEIQQDGYGLMKSGFLLTLSINSAGQLFQHAVVELRAQFIPALRLLLLGTLLWAMGDDSILYLSVAPLPAFVDAYVKELSTLGCLVKHAKVRREFAGFHIQRDSATPLYGDKHKFTLYWTKPEMVVNNLVAYSYVYAMATDVSRKWLEEQTRQREMPSASHFRAWGKGLPVPSLDELLRVMI